MGRRGPSAITPDLLLVHVTAVGAAREVIESGQLEATHCRVFRRNLTYFFVLRPAYRFADGDQKSEQISRFPFVFIASPEKLGPPLHVYPFDTGGAASGIFEDRPDPFVFLEDYELEPTLDAAAAHISWAFGSRQAYYDGDLRDGISSGLHAWDTCPKSFATIAGLASSRNNKPDKRASSIEVAYRDHIPLKGNVRFAIIPKQFLEDAGGKNEEFIKKLTAAGIGWDVYDWQPNMRPDDYRDEITRLVRAYLTKAGQL